MMSWKNRRRPGELRTALAMLLGAVTLAPAAELTWVRTGGPPGGLGYDIRYKFDDPNTWYVTDAYAGVFVSTDNGSTWQPSNNGIPGQTGPTGDAIAVFCLTVDPLNPQIIWAGTTGTGHLYRSTDAGNTWEQRDNGVTVPEGGLSFRGVTVDPRSSDIVYAMAETSDPLIGFGVWGEGTGGVVYKTTDSGENWQLIWDGGIPSSLARYCCIDPRDPDVLYVSTGIFDRGAVGEGDPDTDPDPFGGLGVLKSTDGGQTWRELNEANGLQMLYIGSLFMHPDDPDVLLAAAGHLTPVLVLEQQLQGEPSTAGVYRTADGGETWTHVLVPPAEHVGEAFASVKLCPSDPNIGYAGSEMAMYRTEDGGQSWGFVAGGAEGWGPPGVATGWPIDMQCDPRDPNRVFANNYGGGNFLSEDGGRTWKNASDGYTGAQLRGVGVDPSAPGRVYVAGRSGGWRSDDGGATWTGFYSPSDDCPSLGLEWVSIATDPSQPGHVLAGHGDILESHDGGQSWACRHSVMGEDGTGESGAACVIVFAPSDLSIVYAAICCEAPMIGHEPFEAYPGGDGVRVSYDGGTTWQRTSGQELDRLSANGLAVDPTDAETVYVATDAGLFKTTDGGARWTELSGLSEAEPAIRVVAVSPTDPQYVLAGVDGVGVYRSLDGGTTWEASYVGLESNGSLHDIVFDPTESENVYVSDYRGGVYRSTDGGETWSKINDGLDNRAALGLSVSLDGEHLYAATDGGGLFRLDLSGDPPPEADPLEVDTEEPPDGGEDGAADGDGTDGVEDDADASDGPHAVDDPAENGDGGVEQTGGGGGGGRRGGGCGLGVILMFVCVPICMAWKARRRF